MRRLLMALAFLAAAAWAANVKLYLKDGTYQIAREYKVESDRVRFYSVERSDWEEIPLALIDLKRTQAEAAEHEKELEHDTKVLTEEDAAEKAIRKEVSRIPQDPGVYWLDGDQTRQIKPAESMVRNNRRREVLKLLSPIPVFSGKGTLEIDFAHSPNVFTNPEQEFYIQLSEPERFGIAKLTPKGTVRIVENLTFQPITKEVEEDPTLLDIFQQQLDASGLYKLWPKKPYEPGEYAVIQFTPGKLNTQVWDFAIKPKKK
jgi:hypothetical protein